MNRRYFLSFLQASPLGLLLKKNQKLFKEGCSYCGKIESFSHGITYSALTLNSSKDRERRVCIDCLIYLFDSVLSRR